MRELSYFIIQLVIHEVQSHLKFSRRKFKVIVALIKSGNNDPSKSMSWKVMESLLSHLKIRI